MDAYSEGIFVVAVAEIFKSSQVSSLSATAFWFWFTSAYRLEMSKLTAVVTFLLICRTVYLPPSCGYDPPQFLHFVLLDPDPDGALFLESIPDFLRPFPPFPFHDFYRFPTYLFISFNPSVCWFSRAEI